MPAAQAPWWTLPPEFLLLHPQGEQPWESYLASLSLGCYSYKASIIKVLLRELGKIIHIK